MVVENLRIDVTPGGVPLVIHVSQYDAGLRQFVFTPYDKGVAMAKIAGATVAVEATKPDGYAVQHPCTYNNDGTITYTLQEQLAACEGQVWSKLTWRDSNGNVLGAKAIVWAVDMAGIADGAIVSSSDLPLIEQAAEFAGEYEQKVAEMIEEMQIIPGQVVIDGTLTVQGAAADAKATGDRLADLQSALEQLEPGLSDEAKEALLACFRHVVWTDGESQTYYDELEAALNDSGRTLESIRAAYISAGHTVYPWDTLDSLKPYLTVTAVYSDGSETVVSGYDLFGNLSTATSIITVGYSGKTTQVNVNVTIDSALLYYLPTGTVLDGTASGGFDTGIKLSDTNKAISFIIDTTDEEILTRVRNLLLVSDRNASTGNTSWQFGFISAQSDDTYTKQYYTIAVSATSQKSSAVANTSHRVKIAVIHQSNTNTYTLFMSVDGVVMYDFTSQTGIFVANDQTAFIGKRPDNQYPWKGTLTTCAIFGRALSTTEARELLGVN